MELLLIAPLSEIGILFLNFFHFSLLLKIDSLPIEYNLITVSPAFIHPSSVFCIYIVSLKNSICISHCDTLCSSKLSLPDMLLIFMTLETTGLALIPPDLLTAIILLVICIPNLLFTVLFAGGF